MDCPNCKSSETIQVRQDDNKRVCMDCGVSWKIKGGESHAAASALEDLKESIDKRFDRLEQRMEPPKPEEKPPEEKEKEGEGGEEKSYF